MAEINPYIDWTHCQRPTFWPAYRPTRLVPHVSTEYNSTCRSCLLPTSGQLDNAFSNRSDLDWRVLEPLLQQHLDYIIRKHCLPVSMRARRVQMKKMDFDNECGQAHWAWHECDGRERGTTVRLKKQETWLLIVTLANVDRFSKFFRR